MKQVTRIRADAMGSERCVSHLAPLLRPTWSLTTCKYSFHIVVYIYLCGVICGLKISVDRFELERTVCKDMVYTIAAVNCMFECWCWR